MKLHPCQAPLYGSCVLTVQLSHEDLCEAGGERENVEFFLLIAGSSQRHVSSTLRVSHDTLQVACPAHDCCESVMVTLCSADLDGLIRHLSTAQMYFVQDLALDMAEFLVSTVGRADEMEEALLLDEHLIPLQECERMDQSLALALAHLTLPPDWNLLRNCDALQPQETLLHFAARRGLQRVSRFLLQQPGAQQALALPNREGATPVGLAQRCGHSALLELLTKEETGTWDSSEPPRRISFGTRVVQHHPSVNTYTLTVVTKPGTDPNSLQTEVQDLCRLILHDTSRGQEESVHQLPISLESPPTTDVFETRESCFTQSEHNGVNTTEQELSPVREKGNKKEFGSWQEPLRSSETAGEPVNLKTPGDNVEGYETQACSYENINKDYGEHLLGVGACEQLDSSPEGERAALSCGKEQEEADRSLDSICQAQQTAEGPDREVQEEGCCLERADEDQISVISQHTDAGDMGIAQSLDTPDSSDDSSSQDLDSSNEREVEIRKSDGINVEFADLLIIPVAKGTAEEDEPEWVHSESSGGYKKHFVDGRRDPSVEQNSGETSEESYETGPDEESRSVTDQRTPYKDVSAGTPEKTEELCTHSGLRYEQDSSSSLTAMTENNCHIPQVNADGENLHRTEPMKTDSNGKVLPIPLEDSTHNTVKDSSCEQQNHPELNIPRTFQDALEYQASDPVLPARKLMLDTSDWFDSQLLLETDAVDSEQGFSTPEFSGNVSSNAEVQGSLEVGNSGGGRFPNSLIPHEVQSVMSEGSLISDSLVTELIKMDEDKNRHITERETTEVLMTELHPDTAISKIHREGQSLCLDDSSHNTGPLQRRHSSESTESPRSIARHSTDSTTLRDSGSDTDGFISTNSGEDSVFRKGHELLGDSASEVSISCSSTDDTASLCQPSSSADSCEDIQRRGETGGGAGADAEEEASDRITEVPLRSTLLRSSGRSLSPFRRHSWGPGKNPAGEEDMNQRSSVRRILDQQPMFHRRSLSWCPIKAPFSSDLDEISQPLSVSLEALAAEQEDGKRWQKQGGSSSQSQLSEDTGSQMSLTDEGQEYDLGDSSGLDMLKLRRPYSFRRNCKSMTLPLRESVSMLSICPRDIDGMRSSSNSLRYSITEEEPGSLKLHLEEKSDNKVSRTFSYLKSKMSKKSREKDKERNREKERDAKDRKAVNGHVFSIVSSHHLVVCQHCNKTPAAKDVVSCTVCGLIVHKSCLDAVSSCSKSKFQLGIPEMTNMPGVTLRTKSSAPRERPWSAILSPEIQHPMLMAPRRHTSIMSFNSSNLSKSMSINNIAVFDEVSLKGQKYLSHSTDSLARISKVNESTECLIDEGTEADGQLMGEFEADAKELEADSWSFTTNKDCLKKLKKNVIKKQEVIYELIQTEMHHLRTLRIMADVYSKGLLKEVHLEPQIVESLFPVLDDLLELHTQFFSSLLERRREAKQNGTFIINRIGDLLVNQFSGSNAERMKKVYSKFCSRHNEAVNSYKELNAKDKRFQSFIKNKMSSSIVRRMGIPDCILLVTQRITKYPVLLQRILQHTKENEEDLEDLTEALQLVKEVIAAVDGKVNEHKKKRRLSEIYSRTDGRSIMRMKSGQMFAREDLIRGRKLLHDGPLQLKTLAGRLKDVQALLLSDVMVFLQEKDQKYVFASLDRRATVISLHKLIVREVANEDRGLFLIAAGFEQPEMVEVYATSRDERNTWMQLIQDAMQSVGKDEDEGIPSETEEDKKLLESKAKEMRDILQRKDDQILSLLQEKMKVFHDMCGSGSSDDAATASRMLFRSCSDAGPKGELIMREALREVEMLQALVHSGLGGAIAQQSASDPGNTASSVFLPRRSETFGGFDSHQINSSKHGDKEEAEDLRRTESDSILKKGGNTNLLLLLKRNREQALSSVTHLHDLLSSLQAVVVQQDTCLEDQRQTLSERLSSRLPSRLPSLVEQEKQRSAERHRQELAAHAEEKRRREKEWEIRDQDLCSREMMLQAKEEEAQKRRRELEEAQREMQTKKEDYQKDLERLRDSQRRLEREKEQMQKEVEKLAQLRASEVCPVKQNLSRTLSNTSEDGVNLHRTRPGDQVMRQEQEEVSELSSSPKKNSLTRGRNLNPFSNFTPKALSAEGQSQIPNRLLQLTRPKDKKKKKSKSKPSQETESHLLLLTETPLDTEIFFC